MALVFGLVGKLRQKKRIYVKDALVPASGEEGPRTRCGRVAKCVMSCSEGSSLVVVVGGFNDRQVWLTERNLPLLVIEKLLLIKWIFLPSFTHLQFSYLRVTHTEIYKNLLIEEIDHHPCVSVWMFNLAKEILTISTHVEHANQFMFISYQQSNGILSPSSTPISLICFYLQLAFHFLFYPSPEFVCIDAMILSSIGNK